MAKTLPTQQESTMSTGTGAFKVLAIARIGNSSPSLLTVDLQYALTNSYKFVEDADADTRAKAAELLRSSSFCRAVDLLSGTGTLVLKDYESSITVNYTDHQKDTSVVIDKLTDADANGVSEFLHGLLRATKRMDGKVELLFIAIDTKPIAINTPDDIAKAIDHLKLFEV